MITTQLSIIVPAYNVVRYLDNCMRSLMAQQLPEDAFEIVLVDDGSTDGTSDLADQWAARCPQVVVVHQANQGLSAARNSGLRQARGEYVLLVDSDDSLVEGTIGGLLQTAQQQALDVVRFQYLLCTEATDKERVCKVQGARNVVMNGKDFLAAQKGFRCYAWTYLIRRAVLEWEEALRFEPGILYEDVVWTPQMLLRCERAMITDVVAYRYLLRKGSITHEWEPDKVKKNIENQLLVIDRLLQQREDHRDVRWYDNMIWAMCESVLTTIASRGYALRDEFLPQVVPIIRRVQPYAAGQTRMERIKTAIMQCSPALYCALRHIH